ncbi:MAG: site-specific integrase, partial [Gammaproteobacteria bacterium]|nr:site-specific integrase [Gammaproteobacteria bacterium]
DWARAKRQADEAAAGFAVHEPNGKAEAEPEPLTLGRLFDIYGEEVTPTKGKRTRNRDRVASAMFLDFFGRDRRPETLSQRDWDRFIQARRAGRAGLSGEPVGNRTIAWDLTFLMAVLNWAARSRDEEGNLLLDSNPLRGLRKPREKNPNRVVLTEDEYRAMLNVSRQVGWRFHVAFVLAHETGHRIGAIRKLRWPDIDFENKTIRWRAEHEKTGYGHITPLTDEAIAVLEEARRMGRGKKNGPVLPSTADAAKGISRVCTHNWWWKAQTFAGLEPKRGRGWHSLRRKFATDLMDLPLKVLCELGGWKSPQTVLRCYQQADAGQLRKALESRPRART